MLGESENKENREIYVRNEQRNSRIDDLNMDIPFPDVKDDFMNQKLMDEEKRSSKRKKNKRSKWNV